MKELSVDLRSDTVTRPTLEMRQHMVNAEVGDDVYGEDPQARALEEEVAGLLGKEAGLFVPSGTMGNQIALMLHTRPGQRVLAGQAAHCLRYESGGAAALSGVQISQVGGGGLFTAAELHEAFESAENVHASPTTLVTVENTHNVGGGICWPREALAEVIRQAADLGMATHLDGARLWNAAIASGASLAALAEGFDTATVCLSKGLGAPAGSVLVGAAPLMSQARRLRKMLGGGMRQVGILCAAGRYALAHHRERLGEDHERARRLAEALAATPSIRIKAEAVQTNIVVFEHARADALLRSCSERGVRLSPFGSGRLRAVTHLDVDDQGIEAAIAVIGAEAAALI